MDGHSIRKRKDSIALSPNEVELIKEYRKEFRSTTACALSIGIDRTVLDRILMMDPNRVSTSAVTARKIRRILKKLGAKI